MKTWLAWAIGRPAMGMLAMAVVAAGAITSATPAGAVRPKPDIHGEAGKLRVYFIDVEGGQSTLFVTPSGASLLIDTGWPGNEGRDAGRIVAAAKDAGLTHIDYALITHYHEDHAGGIPQLAERIPVGAYLDHGENRELDKGITERDYALYQKELAKGKSKVIHETPGNVLAMGELRVTVVSSDGRLTSNPLPGAGEANPYCKDTEARPVDETENARSLGVELEFGKLKLLDLGDLTWRKEVELMCPANKLGRVGVYIVSHHGWNQSSSPALVDAIHARVAIMDNGAKKGGSTSTLETLKAAPGLEALWQLHYSEEGGAAHNTAGEFIANPEGEDAGHWLELIGSEDGSFDVVNGRTGVAKHYPAAP